LDEWLIFVVKWLWVTGFLVPVARASYRLQVAGCMGYQLPVTGN